MASQFRLTAAIARVEAFLARQANDERVRARLGLCGGYDSVDQVAKALQACGRISREGLLDISLTDDAAPDCAPSEEA
jgi:hypothetical protein